VLNRQLERFPKVATACTKFLGVWGIRRTNLVDLIWKQQDSEKGTEIRGKVEDKRLRFWVVEKRLVGPLGEWAMGRMREMLGIGGFLVERSLPFLLLPYKVASSSTKSRS
jgi:hypothetical protein